MKQNEQTTKAATEIQRQLEAVAEQYVLLESDDIQGLTGLREHLDELRSAFSSEESLSDAVKQECAAAVEKACSLVQKIIAGESENPKKNFMMVGETLLGLQTLGQHSPDGLKVQTDAGKPVAPELNGTKSNSSSTSTLLPADKGSANPLIGIEIADKDLAKEFVAEAQEYFQTADDNLLILENDPENAEAIGAVFRAFHTVKGVAGFIGLAPIQDLAHQAETLLDMVRSKELSFSDNVVDVTFRSLDLLKAMVEDVNLALVSGSRFIAKSDLAVVLECLENAIKGGSSAGGSTKTSDASIPISAPSSQQDLPEAVLEEGTDENAKGEVHSSIKQAVKIDADRLDLLIDTIGELVIAEAMVSQDPELKALRSLRVQKNLVHLSKITRMLQDMSMLMRMVPVDNIFRKMGRLVRDSAKKAGKRVDLTLSGKETELDRGMVDKLNDPLVHMIRNAVDHGLETEAERVAAGKTPHGNITLKAYHRGGNIYIDIADDGKGLNKAAILKKGIERGLISTDQNLSDKEIFALIFEPGFSTAKQVTEISGRGVGMDVVYKNVSSLRGNVLIDSVPGKGTTFTLVLPLTTAIIDGISVRVGTETYIIPTLSILESLKPTGDMTTTVVGKGEVIRFRDSLLPLFRLSALFSIKDALSDLTRATIVVVEETGRRTALLVDELLGQQQTVIKPLGEGVGSVPGISGASILADGRPGLVLDVGGIVKLATKQVV